MKTLILLAENQGANWSLIWSDISLFVCVILLILAVYFWHKQQTQRENYLVKGTAKICKLEGEKMDLQTRINELEEKAQKRNPDGTFATKTGKGHGKKRKDWTKASKEELLTEAKKRYPVGTKFLSVHTGNERTVKSHEQYENTFVNDSVNFLVVNPSEWCNGASVYSEGQWAKIIKP